MTRGKAAAAIVPADASGLAIAPDHHTGAHVGDEKPLVSTTTVPLTRITCEFRDTELELEFRERVLRPAMRRACIRIFVLLGLLALAVFTSGVVRSQSVKLTPIAYGTLSVLMAALAFVFWRFLEPLPGRLAVWEGLVSVWLCVVSVGIPLAYRASRMSGQSADPEINSVERIHYVRGAQFLRQVVITVTALGLAPIQLRWLGLVAVVNTMVLIVLEMTWPLGGGWALPEDYVAFFSITAMIVLIRRCFYS